MSDAPPRAGGARRLLILLPLVLFGGLAALFGSRLFSGADPNTLPSALIGRPVPGFDLPQIAGVDRPPLTSADLAKGRVSIVNVFASWCVPCRDEHPVLMRLSRSEDYDLYGINNKDKAENARRFLGALGNPFKRLGADESGRVSIDWGVYGVPETFVIDGAGRITFKHVGPLSDAIVEAKLLPAIRAAASTSR